MGQPMEGTVGMRELSYGKGARGVLGFIARNSWIIYGRGTQESTSMLRIEYLLGICLPNENTFIIFVLDCLYF